MIYLVCYKHFSLFCTGTKRVQIQQCTYSQNMHFWWLLKKITSSTGTCFCLRGHMKRSKYKMNFACITVLSLKMCKSSGNQNQFLSQELGTRWEMGTNAVYFDGTKLPLVLTSRDVYTMACSSSNQSSPGINNHQLNPRDQPQGVRSATGTSLAPKRGSMTQ